jgi:DNA mismatch repair protein MutS
LKESYAIIPIKTLALESKQEAVKIIGDSLHSCELLREKIKTTLNQDALLLLQRECDRKRGERRADERDFYFRQRILEGIEARESERTGMKRRTTHKTPTLSLSR